MTAIDPATLDVEARRARRFARINKADTWFRVLGLSWLTPILKAVAGDNPRAQGKEIWQLLGVPLLAEIPLHLDIRMAADGGAPIVVSKPGSSQAEGFTRVAKALIEGGHA